MFWVFSVGYDILFDPLNIVPLPGLPSKKIKCEKVPHILPAIPGRARKIHLKKTMAISHSVKNQNRLRKRTMMGAGLLQELQVKGRHALQGHIQAG